MPRPKAPKLSDIIGLPSRKAHGGIDPAAYYAGRTPSKNNQLTELGNVLTKLGATAAGAMVAAQSKQSKEDLAIGYGLAREHAEELRKDMSNILRKAEDMKIISYGARPDVKRGLLIGMGENFAKSPQVSALLKEGVDDWIQQRVTEDITIDDFNDKLDSEFFGPRITKLMENFKDENGSTNFYSGTSGFLQSIREVTGPMRSHFNDMYEARVADKYESVISTQLQNKFNTPALAPDKPNLSMSPSSEWRNSFQYGYDDKPWPYYQDAINWFSGVGINPLIRESKIKAPPPIPSPDKDAPPPKEEEDPEKAITYRTTDPYLLLPSKRNPQEFLFKSFEDHINNDVVTSNLHHKLVPSLEDALDRLRHFRGLNVPTFKNRVDSGDMRKYYVGLRDDLETRLINARKNAASVLAARKVAAGEHLSTLALATKLHTTKAGDTTGFRVLINDPNAKESDIRPKPIFKTVSMEQWLLYYRYGLLHDPNNPLRGPIPFTPQSEQGDDPNPWSPKTREDLDFFNDEVWSLAIVMKAADKVNERIAEEQRFASTQKDENIERAEEAQAKLLGLAKEDFAELYDGKNYTERQLQVLWKNTVDKYKDEGFGPEGKMGWEDVVGEDNEIMMDLIDLEKSFQTWAATTRGEAERPQTFAGFQKALKLMNEDEMFRGAGIIGTNKVKMMSWLLNPENGFNLDKSEVTFFMGVFNERKQTAQKFLKLDKGGSTNLGNIRKRLMEDVWGLADLVNNEGGIHNVLVGGMAQINKNEALNVLDKELMNFFWNEYAGTYKELLEEFGHPENIPEGLIEKLIKSPYNVELPEGIEYTYTDKDGKEVS